MNVNAKITIKPNKRKDTYFICHGCNSEYVEAPVDIDSILNNFCPETEEEIAAMVHHYYGNRITLTQLLLNYRTGIVRRHNNKLGYFSSKVTSRILFICFKFDSKRTVGSFIRSEDKDCYTMKALEVPRI